ncbi:family 10 glycosylhydrolase [uncultured Maribacter sp.]|uniref:glycoside hydrolase family 10 protein n=1 Tax=uncultured Maribacter sp. TaxID=431308 RepID=UPI00263A2CB2|nr:family 10 glycosylhydrolase [uncultured Maribacter sp.]
MTKFFLLLLSFAALISCSSLQSYNKHPKTEFRGVWIATVVNIDWPKNGLDEIEKQKKDYLEILDFYQNLNFNAVIVQIRTAGDSFYRSEYAPWSRFLTGKEGKAPKENFDVLGWMINEAHSRGMEFHAWLNPYRATFDLKTEVLSPTHDFNLHPEWMVKYGKKYYYNPGLPEVQEKMVSIMKEVVADYDIDAIHFDDYFYPYKIKDKVFQDSSCYEFYKRPKQSIADWRRSNIDSLVKKTYRTIKKEKPWVQFGISPFGVWKNKSTDPKGSDTKAGQTTYEDLYADPLLWMKKGWVDYLIPQVYWSMDLPVASHSKIVDWWAQNKSNSNLYIGNGAYKIRNNSDHAWQKKKELPNQLKLARNTQQMSGNAFFSAKSLMKNNSDVVKYIKRKYYKKAALTPISSLTKNTFNEVKVQVSKHSEEKIEFTVNSPQKLRYAIIYDSGKKTKLTYPTTKLLNKTFIDDSSIFSISKSEFKGKKHIAITFINYYGRESKPTVLKIKND